MLSKAAQSGSPLNAITQFARRITAADLTDAATSQTFDLGDPHFPPDSDEPYNGVLGTGFVGFGLDQVFAGPGITACTVEIGTDADPDQFVAASDIFTGADVAIENAAPIAMNAGGLVTLIVPNDAANPFQFRVTIRTTGGDVADLVDGDLQVQLIVLEFRPV